ncbi:uncharacterized protein PV06_06236 [Exophiala oligosperma]|uniref:Uncharacterized protein n=1 Tax=Exophiala oligosperma TaxID=215243 RepID=A0A0D2AS50_9EURO|nr:uncharacterized protein PV06_06236 [Exophiala oligosperma]KIW42716.1 hypothetical protein PV06_06236 [Exophiala oligosperma]
MSQGNATRPATPAQNNASPSSSIVPSANASPTTGIPLQSAQTRPAVVNTGPSASNTQPPTGQTPSLPPSSSQTPVSVSAPSSLTNASSHPTSTPGSSHTSAAPSHASAPTSQGQHHGNTSASGSITTAAQASTPSPPAQPSPTNRSRMRLFKLGLSSFSGTPEEWVTNCLQPWGLGLLFLFTIGLAVTLFVLARKSAGAKGIAEIRKVKPDRNVAGVALGLTLTWKQIPTFTIQAYGMCLAAAFMAFAQRQPYVELNRADGGAPAKASILLDYGSLSWFSKIKRAWQSKHALLLLWFFMSPIFSLGVTPLAANLFDLDEGQVAETNIKVNRTTFYDEWAIEADTQLLPMLTYVTGIELYDTPMPAWADQNASYAPFEIPAGLDGTSDNVTVVQNASFMDLDCRALLREVDFDVVASDHQWLLNGTDQGCDFINQFQFSDGFFQNYAQTWTKNDCGDDDSDGGTSSSSSSPTLEGRVFLFAAHAPDGNGSAVTNFSMISCTTTYHNHTGKLVVGVDPSNSNRPLIRNFQPTARPQLMEPRPQYWKIFEQSISSFAVDADPTSLWSATSLGRLVIEAGVKNNGDDSNSGSSSSSSSSKIPDEAFRTENLITQFKAAWRLLYIVTATTYLHPLVSTTRPTGTTGTTVSGSDDTLDATLHLTTSYLRTADAIAYSFVGVFLVNAALIVWMAQSMRLRPSILREEPTGLLGHLFLAANSAQLMGTARAVRHDVAGPSPKWQEAYEKGQVTTVATEYQTARWRVVDWSNSRDGRIERCP